MSNNNSNNKNHTISTKEGEVKGRTYNSQHPSVDKAAAKADISAVDQQEGNMNPGETGPAILPENETGESEEKTA